MKSYTKTETVEAVQVVHTVGTKIVIDKKGTEVDLGNEFATRYNYKPGDMVMFQNGKPVGWMTEAAFNAVYKAKK